MISSYVGENAEFERQMLSGELDVECLKELLLKMSRCTSRYTCFLHPLVTEKWLRERSTEFNGKMHIMELA
jgi:3-oxoacid CoA-transferase subunit A